MKTVHVLAAGTLLIAFSSVIDRLRAQEGAASSRLMSTSGPARAPSYTVGQALRGEAVYQLHCASCHGTKLDNGPMAPPLTGAAFLAKFGGRGLDHLQSVIRTMPPADPTAVSDTAATDLLAFIAQHNAVIASDTELSGDPSLLAAVSLPNGSFMAGSPYAPPPVPIDRPDPFRNWRPVTAAELANPPAEDWLSWRRTYDAHGFSPLRQINRANVAKLRLAWSWSLPAGSTLAPPLVRDGVMFVATLGDKVQALDAKTGDLLWQYERRLRPGITPGIKRSIALLGEQLYLGTSDGHAIALDAKTGKLVWETRIGDAARRERLTGGPLVAKGKVMFGTTGTGVGAAVPQIVALDSQSGEIAWRVSTIAQFGAPGGDSWAGIPMKARSGASVWTPGSYEPSLGLAYFGTGNTYDTGPLLHPPANTSADALYTNSTLAIDPDNGRIEWYFQHMPNDQWDLDWSFERQLIRMTAKGRQRTIAVTAGKAAIYDGVDAQTGEYLFSLDLGLQNIVTAIDPQTGKKAINASLLPGDGKLKLICPHPAGARNFMPAAYNPARALLIVPLSEACADMFPAPQGAGALTSGISWGIRPRPDSDGNYGRLEAINLMTGKPAWTVRQRAPLTAGVLATAGGLVFAGSMDRRLSAYDDRTGKLLWSARLNDASSSSPITYSVAGRQYVALLVGRGGFHVASYEPLLPELHNPNERGAAVWVFEVRE